MDGTRADGTKATDRASAHKTCAALSRRQRSIMDSPRSSVIRAWADTAVASVDMEEASEATEVADTEAAASIQQQRLEPNSYQEL